MKYPILALLAAGPAHGYELKLVLDERFGSVLPPLNAGQIYTTLARLDRDGLVEGGHVAQDGRPNKRVYELTAAGREALDEWVDAPTPAIRLKDEFFMKLVLACLSGTADPRTLIDRQRRACLQALRNLTDLAAKNGPNGSTPASLLVEGAVLHLEADLKWLSLCEERLTREGTDGTRPSS